MPLEPYPARSARHLPHAGKALSVVILFPHMRVFALTMREKRYPRIAAFPIEEGFVESTGGADELDFISDDVALGAAIHHTDGKDEGILRIVHAAR